MILSSLHEDHAEKKTQTDGPPTLITLELAKKRISILKARPFWTLRETLSYLLGDIFCLLPIGEEAFCHLTTKQLKALDSVAYLDHLPKLFLNKQKYGLVDKFLDLNAYLSEHSFIKLEESWITVKLEMNLNTAAKTFQFAPKPSSDSIELKVPLRNLSPSYCWAPFMRVLIDFSSWKNDMSTRSCQLYSCEASPHIWLKFFRQCPVVINSPFYDENLLTRNDVVDLDPSLLISSIENSPERLKSYFQKINQEYRRLERQGAIPNPRYTLDNVPDTFIDNAHSDSSDSGSFYQSKGVHENGISFYVENMHVEQHQQINVVNVTENFVQIHDLNAETEYFTYGEENSVNSESFECTDLNNLKIEEPALEVPSAATEFSESDATIGKSKTIKPFVKKVCRSKLLERFCEFPELTEKESFKLRKQWVTLIKECGELLTSNTQQDQLLFHYFDIEKSLDQWEELVRPWGQDKHLQKVQTARDILNILRTHQTPEAFFKLCLEQDASPELLKLPIGMYATQEKATQILLNIRDAMVYHLDLSCSGWKVCHPYINELFQTGRSTFAFPTLVARADTLKGNWISPKTGKETDKLNTYYTRIK